MSTYVRLESMFTVKTKGGVLALTLEEARILYGELSEIFGPGKDKSSTVLFSPGPSYRPQPPQMPLMPHVSMRDDEGF